MAQTYEDETKIVTLAAHDETVADLDELEQEMRDLEDIRQELEEELAADAADAAEQTDWLEGDEYQAPPFTVLDPENDGGWASSDMFAGAA